MRKKVRIQPEDLLLYIVSIGVLVFFGVYFSSILSDLTSTLTSRQNINNELRKIPEVYQIEQRFIFASQVLISNSARNNMSFMIGSVLTILGAMIVIRRVKNETNSINAGNESFKFNFATNSPGLIIAALGCIIIVFSIAYKDNYSITDTEFTNPLKVNTSQIDKDNLKTTDDDFLKK